MTLKEIAAEAGVSISTVSRVINQKNIHAATPELREKIWEIVRRTGYMPSQAAQALKSGQANVPPTKTIACLFARDSVSIADNPYFVGIAQSFEKEALRYNFSVQCSLTTFSLMNNREELIFPNTKVSGILVIGRHDLQTIRTLQMKFRNIVYAGLVPPADNRYDSVLCDARKIGLEATQYLCRLGHRRIAYIGDTNNESRYFGYLDALKSNDLPFKKEYVAYSTLSMEGGYKAAQQLLTVHPAPTAVFCMNDYIALGAMRAFKDAGLNIPRDISVIGVDDIEAAQFASPKLTTVFTPMEELGSVAAKVLTDRISQGHNLPMTVYLPFHIVERNSCIEYTKKETYN